MPYRLFVPGTARNVKVPLVVYLHGADAYGDDNETHLELHDIGTVFFREDWQKKHPCFVAAPQIKAGDHWAHPTDNNRVCQIISELIAEYPEIDPDRIYIYGYSAGGVGVLGLLKTHPEIFTAAISICGATNLDGMDNLMSVPLWLIHAADDDIVRCTYRTGVAANSAWYGSRDIYAYFDKKHPDLHYTEYPAGYMKGQYGVNPHCSWVAAGADEEVKNWLFSH